MDKKVMEKMKDQDFVESLMSMETKDEVIEAFKKENIEISEQDINEIGSLFSTVSSKVSTLSESELDNIGGGKLAEVTNQLKNCIENEGRKRNIDFMTNHSEGIADTAVVGTIALAGVGLYKAGKWVTSHKHWYLYLAAPVSAPILAYDLITKKKKK